MHSYAEYVHVEIRERRACTKNYIMIMKKNDQSLNFLDNRNRAFCVWILKFDIEYV